MSATAGIFALVLSIAPAQLTKDPYLPESVRDTVEKASAAELDPKRGIDNAVQLLRSARAKLPKESQEGQALDLRVAGTILRGKFLLSTEFVEAMRMQQALSTFARLDLWEPGLKQWIDRTLAVNPTVKTKLAKKGAWKMKIGVLVGGSGLDREQVIKAFSAALGKLELPVEVVATKEASLVVKLSAEDGPRQPNGDVAVRLRFDAESIKDGKVVWKDPLVKESAAPDAKAALSNALEWMARVGGRDIFLRWLGENGLELLMASKPVVSTEGHGAAMPSQQKGITPAGEVVDTPLKVDIPEKKKP